MSPIYELLSCIESKWLISSHTGPCGVMTVQSVSVHFSEAGLLVWWWWWCQRRKHHVLKIPHALRLTLTDTIMCFPTVNDPTHTQTILDVQYSDGFYLSWALRLYLRHFLSLCVSTPSVLPVCDISRCSCNVYSRSTPPPLHIKSLKGVLLGDEGVCACRSQCRLVLVSRFTWFLLVLKEKIYYLHCWLYSPLLAHNFAEFNDQLLFTLLSSTGQNMYIYVFLLSR